MQEEAPTTQNTPPAAYHTRLWWMEIVRGALTIIFALLVPFTIQFLLSVLGVYLIIDGTLDILQVATGRRETQRKFINYLVGVVSIVLGLISFMVPRATLFLIAVLISLRILLSAVRVILDARRSRQKYEGLSWLYGILLLLFGLALLSNALGADLIHIEPTSLILLVLFMCSYALIDGIYLLVRGLLLLFAPSLFTAAKLAAPQSPADIPAHLPATTRRALVFVRHPGASGLGHISWAFEWKNGWFNAGSVENEKRKSFANPQEMGFWTAHTLDPIAAMQKQVLTYDEYKVLYVTEPRPKDAWKTVIWESRQPYLVVRHNCNDVAYDILRAYGASELPDPVEGLVPNDWYDSLPGPSYVIKENPTVPVHLHQMSKHDLATTEILLTIPEHIQGATPPWRVKGWRAWQELNDTLDKMVKDVRQLFVSVGRRMKRQ